MRSLSSWITRRTERLWRIRSAKIKVKINIYLHIDESAYIVIIDDSDDESETKKETFNEDNDFKCSDSEIRVI